MRSAVLFRLWLAVATAAALAACGDNLGPLGAAGDAGNVRDGSSSDGRTADASADAGAQDAPPPDGPPPDAPPGVLPCLGDPVPPAEGPTATINGVAVSISLAGQQPVAGATVRAFLTGTTTNQLDSDVSAANGTYALTAPTNGQPVDAYVRATRAGFLDSYLYPPTPVFQAMLNDATTVMLTQNTVDLATLITGTDQPAGRGLIVLIVTDCEGLPIAGATVTSSPAAGAVRYFRNNTPSPSATSTDADGFAVLFDVPPGPVQVDASIFGTSLREHTLDVVPDAIMSTIIAP